MLIGLRVNFTRYVNTFSLIAMRERLLMLLSFIEYFAQININYAEDIHLIKH